MSKAESKAKSPRKKTKTAAKKAATEPGAPQPEQDQQLVDENAELKAQLDEKTDLYTRALAELDNTRKRASRDIEQARKFAVERFAADVLGVADSLDLGLKAADAEDANAATLRTGMDMTLKQLQQVLEKFGITELVPAGEPFNPEFHEAIAMHPSDQQTPNTVLEVVQKGYVMNGRVLRAAKVVVASAPDNTGTA